MAFIGIMHDRDALLANGISDAVYARDQDKPAGYALALNGHPDPPFRFGHLENNTRT
jgi:hypothetical protein